MMVVGIGQVDIQLHAFNAGLLSAGDMEMITAES